MSSTMVPPRSLKSVLNSDITFWISAGLSAIVGSDRTVLILTSTAFSMSSGADSSAWLWTKVSIKLLKYWSSLKTTRSIIAESWAVCSSIGNAAIFSISAAAFESAAICPVRISSLIVWSFWKPLV